MAGLLILIGLVLGFLENRANSYVLFAFGKKGILATAWVGTPVHELGHLLMCILFRHKIQGVRLLDLKSPGGVLGYVRHSWNTSSLYQNIGNFFIGMGPIFSGTGILILGMFLLLPDSFGMLDNYLNLNPGQLDLALLKNMFLLTGELFASIFSVGNLGTLNFWIYFILATCVASHMALSKADLIGAANGLITIFALICLANLLAWGLKADISGFFNGILVLNIYLLAFSMVSIVFSSIRLGLSYFATIMVNR